MMSTISRALVLVMLAACELQPPPKQQAEPPPPAPPVEAVKPVEAPPPAPPPAADAGAGSAATIEITAPCMEVAAKLAQVFIDSQKDPGAKSNAEQARADMTRKMGEACTVQPWSEPQRKCYLAARSEPEIRACEKKFRAPQPAAPQPAAPQPGTPQPAAPAKPGAAR
jgi:hypothetical protein